ncbi:MAG: hypothetical protein A2161_00230 [Candidatus Schekmanbacteria bacterium RBG_13_48_7]|uniref:HTH cro/C1-type domain-containing protein n=1 Tax=Candidatus Schekmanbacteria bacterium RBG_13_48_7 TaxID=1817878 RepID=A0A1F7S5B9_9BACT|nr:MAG: hypothetical protein A2161_00230 [Candidatus Schekmanbacteria bacterium RBG_13_48_7]
MGVRRKSPEEIKVSQKIRELRQIQGLTLRDIAEKTSLSAALISQIENNIVSPPIATLLKIAKALEVKIGYFFEDSAGNHPGYVVTRKSERHSVYRQGSEYGYSYFLLAHGIKEKDMEPFFVTFSGGDFEKDGFFRHDGEEFVFLLKGKVEYQIGENVVTLLKGDSLYLDSNLPHRARCLKKGESQALVVLHTMQP